MIFWAWVSTQAMFLGHGLQNSLPHSKVCVSFQTTFFSTHSWEGQGAARSIALFEAAVIAFKATLSRVGAL